MEIPILDEHFIEEYALEGSNVLVASGGATAFRGIAGAGVRVMELGFKPDFILGVSSGAIAALPLALGLFEAIRWEGDNLTPDKFFSKKPFTKKGKIHAGAIWRLFWGAISLGEQDVKPLLRKIITEELWLEYKTGDYAECIVYAIAAKFGSIKCWNLKECSTREEAFDCIQASSRIAPIVQPKDIVENEVTTRYVDAGFRLHNAAGYFLEKNPLLNVKELVSIYARPKDHYNVQEDWDANFVNVNVRMQTISTQEVSKFNEYKENAEVQKRNIKFHSQIFMPALATTYLTGKDLIQLGIDAEYNAELAYTQTHT